MGLMIYVPGGLALLSLPVSLFSQEWYATGAFLLTALIAFGVAQALCRLFPNPAEVQLRYAMLVVSFGWAAVSLIGALPFLLVGCYGASLPFTERISGTTASFCQPWNALFESFSGFTSTGLSMALSPSQLPYSLQWWRSLSQWVGGVGVIVLTLSLIQAVPGLHRLYYGEARNEKLLPSVVSTVRTIWWIYLLYTVLAIALLWLAGMPAWDALNQGMTGIATGGFALHAESMRIYEAPVQYAMMLVMLAGAVSFATHYQVWFSRKPAVLWRDMQHRLLLVWVGVGGLLITLETVWYTNAFHWHDPLFQWISAVTTCGFSVTSIAAWSPSAWLLMMVAMTFGGAAGSTVGGLKLNRVVILLKGIQWRFQSMNLTPHRLMRYTLGDKVLTRNQANERVENAAVLAALWIVTLGTGVVALLHAVPSDFALTVVAFEVASALGNVGLSQGLTHPGMAWEAKLILILCMWVGRLEIIPVALVIARVVEQR
jgi:trk system potassium uptake protein TrkH